ncbi:TetR/AcrR family transcriptional regulator [Curtobacterium ammoniigenes]|uniref:TetR/AcrR family transcriptional regulator n=1 Tax=Curtobacterium ammoniigenes TaxID=395387 RepID=UPI00083137E5|nr:TetR family transcriptional regulator [Curtobacterium ammoniigenes]
MLHDKSQWDADQDGRPERADAARNRERILETAKRLFAEQGIGVTLNDIAKAAGVGVGTVYRKYPDKAALIEALVAAKFAALTDIADRALAETDPRTALRTYLRGAIALRARDRAIADVIVRAAKGTPAVVRERTRLDAVVTALVQRASDAGVIRPGFDARDLPMLTLMVGAVADRARGCDAAIWPRYAELIIDAVCPPADARAMVGEPLDMAEMERLLADAKA